MLRWKTIMRMALAALCIGVAAMAAERLAAEEHARTLVLNPYEGVDWDTFQRHKAALHVHTLQSDGHHSLEEVVEAYREAGFTILAITDHDNMEPNVHVRAGRVPEAQASPYPRDPKPENYPFRFTNPFGLAPAE